MLENTVLLNSVELIGLQLLDCITCSWHDATVLLLSSILLPIHNEFASKKKPRLTLTIEAINNNLKLTLRRVAKIYNVSLMTLSARRAGRPSRYDICDTGKPQGVCGWGVEQRNGPAGAELVYSEHNN